MLFLIIIAYKKLLLFFLNKILQKIKSFTKNSKLALAKLQPFILYFLRYLKSLILVKKFSIQINYVLDSL